MGSTPFIRSIVQTLESFLIQGFSYFAGNLRLFAQFKHLNRSTICTKAFRVSKAIT